MPSYHPHCPILPSWCGVESFVRPMEFVRSVRAPVIVSLYILLMMRVRGLHLKVEGVNGILSPESTLQKSVVTGYRSSYMEHGERQAFVI